MGIDHKFVSLEKIILVDMLLTVATTISAMVVGEELLRMSIVSAGVAVFSLVAAFVFVAGARWLGAPVTNSKSTIGRNAFGVFMILAVYSAAILLSTSWAMRFILICSGVGTLIYVVVVTHRLYWHRKLVLVLLIAFAAKSYILDLRQVMSIKIGDWDLDATLRLNVVHEYSMSTDIAVFVLVLMLIVWGEWNLRRGQG